jgi:hypothetical protein
MIQSPEKPTQRAAPRARRAQAQALITMVPCGERRGLAALEVTSETGARGEYFLPFSVNLEDPSGRQYTYAALIAAIDKLRLMRVDRVLILVDDELLVDELERRVEPPKELFMQYVIVGCKLNEFRRAKVIAAQSARLEQLRIRAQALASTIYGASPTRQAI